MNLRLERFKRAHIRLFTSYGKQDWIAPYLVHDEEAQALAEGNESWSFFYGDIFLGCGGFVELSPFRAMCWTLLNPTNPKHFSLLHRVIRRLLEGQAERYPRLEAYLDPDFPEARRWAKILGFRVECESKPYFFPDGRTGAEWVRLRD